MNLDNYIGYGEMGEGDQLIAIVGHLDVVPARREDGWNTDPYTMVEKDGILYGRGVSDDKGGVVASMIAMKVIKDMNIPVNKRIRLIMGCNEETGSACLKYYVDHDEQPDYGFTPDGDFPCINGEKGIMGAHYVSRKQILLILMVVLQETSFAAAVISLLKNVPSLRKSWKIISTITTLNLKL